MQPPQKKQITIDRVVITSFIVDLSDVIISLAGTFLTGSVTMLSQTLEGFSDLFSSGFLYLGNKHSKRLPDKRHPYGYGRETYFWALMSGLVTFSIAATLSIYLGYQRFIEPEVIDSLPVALFALVFSFFSNGYSTFLSYKRLMRGKKTGQLYKTFINSPLIEVKTSFILDLIGTIASTFSLTALLIYKFSGDLRFDGIGAMVTGITLALLSIFILVGAKDLLIGRSAPTETLEKIEKAVLSFEKVKTIIDLRSSILGSNKLLITLEINVQDDLTTNELEILIDGIEEKIKKNIHWTALIQVELEAYKV